MRPHPNPPETTILDRNGVYVATGYAIRVSVDHGHLLVCDGVGRHRRAARFHRVTSRLRRLVIIGSTGYVTLDATKWILDAGGAIAHLDHTGRLLTTSATRGLDHPALRRAQARAVDRPVGIKITRGLLDAKLAGQQAVAAGLDADHAATIDALRDRVDLVATLDDLRLIESQAATAYWAAWRGVTIRFATKDMPRVPAHWTTFSQRASLITGNPRTASDPLNAILNYLYAILEAESRVALLAVGLDPGLGILHTDQRARDSLALDLMETVRPHVDKFALDLAATRVFGLADLHETQTGQCRLLPRLAGELATTAPAWSSHVAPHAEMIARTLADEARIHRPPTLLTGATRRGARPSTNQTRPPKSTTPVVRSTACCECGTTIPRGQKRCPHCHATANAERLRRQQADEAARRRTTGEHPSQDQHVRDRISKTQRSQWATRKATNPPSGFTGQPSEFRRLITPRLAGMSPRELAAGTGLSPGYCAAIRDGKRIPAVRHWPAFQLAGLTHRSDR